MMKTIQLTKGLEATVSEEDYSRVSEYKWFSLTTRSGRGPTYAASYVNGRKNGENKPVLLHHFIAGRPAPGFIVDHKDGNTLNFCRDNLRHCTHQQNTQNAAPPRSKITSRFKGVSFNTRAGGSAHWMARYAGRYLGIFNEEEAAANAYDAYVTEHFAEHAYTNKNGRAS